MRTSESAATDRRGGMGGLSNGLGGAAPPSEGPQGASRTPPAAAPPPLPQCVRAESCNLTLRTNWIGQLHISSFSVAEALRKEQRQGSSYLWQLPRAQAKDGGGGPTLGAPGWSGGSVGVDLGGGPHPRPDWLTPGVSLPV